MDFYQKMALVCARIPAGRVATYGQIALLCGKPRNARQVGYGLREELAGDVPAHRVVNAKGGGGRGGGADAGGIPGGHPPLRLEEHAGGRAVPAGGVRRRGGKGGRARGKTVRNP